MYVNFLLGRVAGVAPHRYANLRPVFCSFPTTSAIIAKPVIGAPPSSQDLRFSEVATLQGGVAGSEGFVCIHV